MNAFCNCPLNPVFQGPMVVTPRLRHIQKIIVAKITDKDTPPIMITYFQKFLELSVWFCSVVSGSEKFDEVFRRWGWGRGAGIGVVPCLCFFGTAGKVPLLLELVTVLIESEEGNELLTGAAARLLDSSRSLRRWVLTIFCALSSTSSRTEPVQIQDSIVSYIL